LKDKEKDAALAEKDAALALKDKEKDEALALNDAALEALAE